MPTYEFRCPDGKIIERIFKISEVPAEIPCPDGQGMAQRIISGGAGLLFKGTGFYITDYGKDGKKDQRAGSSSSSESGGGSSGSESKSAEARSAEGKSSEGKSSEAKTSNESKSSGKSESKSESKAATPPPSKPKSD